MKKLFASVLVVVLLFSLFVVGYADGGQKNAEPKSLKELAAINGVSEQKMQELMDYYQKEADEAVLNGPQRFKEDTAKMERMFKEDSKKAEKMYFKEAQRKKAGTVMTLTSSLGTYGDILVTFTGGSSSSNYFLPGHAAIVSWDSSSKTIEAYPASNSPIGLEGVQWYTNDWGSRSKVYALGVYNATATNYKNAALAAQYRVGKPYNWNFLWKYDMNSFYCSQLVWRCWQEQNFELDYVTFDTVVSPAELTKSSNVYCYYYMD